MKYRRIVTNIKDQIESDKILDPSIEYDDGHKLTEIWTTSSAQPNLIDTHHKKEFSLNLDIGCTRFVTCSIPPMSFIENINTQNNDFDKKKYGLHSTQTIDYVIVFEGEVELLVGNETVSLKKGDVVVQRGAIHAWRNKTEKPAEIIAVMIGAHADSKFSKVVFEQTEKS